MGSLTNNEARFIEGYAAALQDVITEFTGSNSCAKRYDPLTVSEAGDRMLSYAFNMKDGSRSHPLCNYKNIDEIKTVLTDEAVRDIKGQHETCI